MFNPILHHQGIQRLHSKAFREQLLWEDFDTQLSGGLGGARLLPAQLLTALLGGNGRGTSLGLGESFKNNCNNSQPVPTTVTLY